MVVCDLSDGKQNLLNVVSVITSAAMLMYKVRALRPFATSRFGFSSLLLLQQVGLFETVQARWAEKELLLELQRTLHTIPGQASPAAALAAASASQAAAPAASVSQAVAAGSSQGGGFVVSRSAPPAPAAPVLANIQQLGAEDDMDIRGVCDGCGQNVTGNDDGRLRDGSKYYHEQCVKGLCGGCGRIVHANADRGKIAGVYWHRDCL